MSRKPRKPFQFGLASLFWLTALVAVVLGLGWAYWLHIGLVVVQILIVIGVLSLAGGLLVLPMLAVIGLQKAFELVQLLIDAWETRRAAKRRQASEDEIDAD